MKYFYIFLFITYVTTADAQCLQDNVDLLINGIDVDISTNKSGCTEWEVQFIELLNSTDTIREFEITSAAKVILKSSSNAPRAIYLCAKLFEQSGKLSSATPLYKKLIVSTPKSGLLNLLSQIGLANSSSNASSIDQLVEFVSNEDIAKAYSPDETAIAVLNLGYVVEPNSRTQLFVKKLDLIDKIANTKLKYIFTNRILFVLNPQRVEVPLRYRDTLKKTYNLIKSEQFEITHSLTASQLARFDKKFKKSYKIISEVIRQQLGPFDNTTELIKLSSKRKYNAASQKLVEKFATTSLFLTREGKGLPPVLDAFEVFHYLHSRNIKERIIESDVIASNRTAYQLDPILNSLIIATYLNQKTGDSTYLNRALEVIDGHLGAGLHHWIPTRNLMRQDEGFARRIRENQAAIKAMKYETAELDFSEIQALEEDIRTSRAALLENYGAHYDSLYPGSRLDVNQLRRELGSDTAAAVCFYTNADILYRVLLTGDTVAVDVLNGVRREATALAERFPRLILRKEMSDSLTAVSRRLYALLLADLAPLLPEQVHIVANDVFENLPFSALRMDTSGTARYFGLVHALSRQFSLRSMQMLDAAGATARRREVFALAPDFPNTIPEREALAEQGFRLPKLFYNADEVKAIAAIAPGSYTSGEVATLRKYRRSAADYGSLHLATHAISSQQDGLRSRIFFPDEAGVNASLYATDIGQQTLNAELVTLSACETGAGGQHSVEGTIGLHRAFLSAGARSVVASSWAVDDQATEQLMGSFYEALSTGLPPHRALRKARQEYLAASPDASPYHWAAFEAYGGMRPVRWERSGRSWWPWLVLLGVGVGVGVSKNRRHAA